MKISITRRCSIQPSIAQTKTPGEVLEVTSVEKSETAGWSRLVGTNGVPFLLPTDAFRAEGGPNFHGVMVAGARKAASGGAERSRRVHAYVADRACR